MMKERSAQAALLIRRRRLLAAGATAGIVAGLGVPPSPALAGTNDDAFRTVSAFLVGTSVDPALAARYLNALQRHHPDFMPRLADLQQAIHQSGKPDMDSFMGLQAPASDVLKTASLIVSAWYLGIVGHDAKAELIAYADALMYRPTRGALVVPTYGAGPNAWGPKPVVSL